MGLLVVVLVAATASPEAAEVQGLVGAAEEALGPNAIVVVRELPATPSDDDARAIETTLHGDAVVVLTCEDPACDAARLHVGLATESFHDRTIKFASADAPNERGRTLGFALASMIPPRAPPLPTPPPPPAAPPPPPTPLRDVPPSSSTTSRRVFVDVLSTIASGVGGTFGVEANARVELGASFFAGASFGARFSAVDAATARSTLLLLGPFVSWSPLRTGALEAGLRLDALAMRQSLSRRETGESGDRWVPAARFTVEAAAALGAHVGLVAFGGPEATLGTTRVLVGDSAVTTLPRWRAIFALGLRGSF